MDHTEKFQASLAVLTTATAAVTAHKGDAKVLRETVTKASREAGWIAFDMVSVMNDSDAATAEGDRLARLIATARGVADKSLAVYAQRGRAFVTYRDAIAKAGGERTILKGERKGETVNGRDESDPLTVAKTLLETAKANAEAVAKVAADMPLQRQAEEAVAEREGLTEDTLRAVMQMTGDASAEAWSKVHAEMDAIRAKATARANLGDAMEAITAALQDGALAALAGGAAAKGYDGGFGDWLADIQKRYRETLVDTDAADYEPVGDTGAVRMKDAA